MDTIETIRGFTADIDTEGFFAGRIILPGVNHAEISRIERERALAHHRASRAAGLPVTVAAAA